MENKKEVLLTIRKDASGRFFVFFLEKNRNVKCGFTSCSEQEVKEYIVRKLQNEKNN